LQIVFASVFFDPLKSKGKQLLLVLHQELKKWRRLLVAVDVIKPIIGLRMIIIWVALEWHAV
jgi:hypothetical protein